MAERTNPHANIVVGAQDEASSKFAQIGQNAQKMGDAVERGANKASDSVGKIGDKAQPAADKLDGATRSIINSIERATAAMQAGEKGTSSYYEALAKQRNVPSDALTPYLTQLRQAEEAQKALLASQNNVGVSARQTAAALRGVPAQITDIVVSLQGGQKPLTVLLQQGGQLKDMFGGIVPAARALGSVLIAQLANPAVAAAAALVGIAAAYNAGSKEADDYRLALVSTGNAVGLTVGQMNQMAASIDGVVGTQGKAAETLALFAAKSVAGSDSLEKYAQSAIEWERASGQAVTETAKMFGSLQDDPLKSVLKLNDGMNFLTESVYEQIKSLEEQGRTIEAAKVAQDALADALSSRSGEMVKNLGSIEKAWRSVKDVVAETWDAIKSVGRDAGPEGQLAAAQAAVANLEALAARGGSATQTPDFQKKLDAARENFNILMNEVGLNQLNASIEADRAEKVKARARWDQEGEKFLGKQVKMEREIAKARGEAEAAGRSEAELQERIANIREKYKEKKSTGVGAENELASLTARTVAAKLYYDQLITLGAGASQLNEGERKSLEIGEKMARTTDAKTLAILRQQKAQADALGVQLRVNAGLEDSLKAHQASIDAVYKDADSIEQRAKAQEAANATFGKGKTAIEEMTLAELQKQMAEAQGSDSFDPKYIAGLELKIAAQKRWVAALEAADYKKLNAHADELLRNAQEMAKTYADEQQLAGLTRLERDKIVALRQVELKYAKELAAIDKMPENSDEQIAAKAEARAKVEQARRIEGEAAVSKAIQDDWQRTTDEINRSLTDALLRGFESGNGFAQNLRDTLKNMFNTLVLRPIISAVMNPVAGLVNGAVQGGVSAVLGGGAGNATSLYNIGSSIYNAITGGFSTLSTTLGGWISSAGSYVGSTAAQGFGMGMQGMTLDASLASTYGASASAGSTAAAAMPYVALVAAAATVASNLWNSGWTSNALKGPGSTPMYSNLGPNPEKPIRGLLSAIGLSDKWADILSGTTRMAALFGRKLKDQGVEGDFGGDRGFDGWTWQYYKGGLFRSNKTTYGSLDEETRQAFAGTFDAMRLGTKGMAEVLGLGSDAIDNFTAHIKVSLNGLSDADADKAIKEEFNKIAESLASATLGTQEYTHEGETAVQTLTRLTTSLTSVNVVLGNLGDTMFQASLAGANMASSLADLLGGLDNFKQISTSYFQNFYTATEQRDAVKRELERQFSSLNLTLPDINADNARDQFRAIATSLDKTTEEGMKTWAALMQLSDTFASVTVSADDAARAAAQAEQERQQAAQRAAEEAARAAADAQKRILQAQRDALNQQIDLIRESLSSLTGVFDLVHNAARDLFGQVDGAAAMQATQGRTFITQALAALKTTGYLPDVDKLRDAITAARGGLDSGSYANTAQQDYDRLVLANQLSAMEKIVGPQKTTAEKQLEMLKQQIASIDQTTRAVNGTTSAVYNLNASLSTSVKNDAIKSAFTAFSDDPLRVAKISLGAGWSMDDVAYGLGQNPSQWRSYFANFGITSFSDSSQLTAIEQRYAAIKGTLGSYTADPQATYNISRSRGWTQYDLAGAFQQHPTVVWDFFDKLGIPRFAVGTNYVPRDMLAQIHEGEAIVPKAFNPWAGGGASGGNDRLVQALIDEVRALRAQVDDLLAAQDEGNNNTGKFAAQFDNWTMGGAGSAPVHAVEVA